MIYLDNSATTKPDPSVLDSFLQATTVYFGNPSSVHQLGGTAEKLLQQSKQQVAQLLNVKESEIIFTSGGTESNNTAIKGIALQHQNRGRHIITSAIEHASIIEPCQALTELGFEITYVPVDEDGVVSPTAIQDAIRDDTILISIMHVNNEIGSIQPISDIAAIANQHPKLFFHVDAVQGIGKVPLDLSEPGIDMVTMSGHKIHGLKGTGLLYIKEGTSIFPLLHGGHQEQGLRAGTENVAGIVAFAKALRLAIQKQDMHGHELSELHNMLRRKLEHIPDIQINTPIHAAPHIMNISTPWHKPEVLVHMLAEKGIYISTKSACTSKQSEASTVLLACGHSQLNAKSAVRISLAYDTTEEDVTTFVDTLTQIINQLQKVMK
ncbi:cysteine desulfurase family protein [Lentibacillus saliphilus]|uniref:cysteine desulfurase family protein n=1 Tax=Lentibacillus saliphilus TaxID=2737028 RepID=UPI001C2FBE34|nr:cysteine desulfurase family protein [Lentibacillus saliphilus]